MISATALLSEKMEEKSCFLGYLEGWGIGTLMFCVRVGKGYIKSKLHLEVFSIAQSIHYMWLKGYHSVYVIYSLMYHTL